MLTSTTNRGYLQQNAFHSAVYVEKIINSINAFNSTNEHSLIIIRNLFKQSANDPWFSMHFPSIITNSKVLTNPELLELFNLYPNIMIKHDYHNLHYISRLLLRTSRAILRGIFFLKGIPYFDDDPLFTQTLDYAFINEETHSNIMLNNKTVCSYIILYKIIYDYSFDYVSNHYNSNLSLSLEDMTDKFGFIPWSPLNPLTRRKMLDRTQYFNLIKWFDRIMNVINPVHYYYRTDFLKELNVHFVKTWLKLKKKLNGKPVYQHSFNPRNVIVRAIEYLCQTNQTDTFKYLLPKIMRLDPENVFHVFYFSWDFRYLTQLLEILIESDGNYFMKPLRQYSNKSRLHQIIYRLHESEIFAPNHFKILWKNKEFQVLKMEIMNLYVLYKRYNLLNDEAITKQLFGLICECVFADFSKGKENELQTIQMIKILKDSSFKRCRNELFRKTPTPFTNHIFRIIHQRRIGTTEATG